MHQASKAVTIHNKYAVANQVRLLNIFNIPYYTLLQNGV